MELVQKVLSGDVRTVARLISDIDDGVPGARQILKELYPHTGNAFVIGVTGAPGVGKSTLVDQMVSHLRKQEKTVGILAVDPSSPFSGGAILGDRIRMRRHSNDRGVYIRSLATRGHFGGLTHSTRGIIDVLDAMGKDIIIIETVGVGQDEVDVVRNAHTTAVVVIPGMGDDIQAIKAGILEVGDIFVINKSDRDGSDKTLNDLRSMIEMGTKNEDSSLWEPPIVKTIANSDEGIEELLNEIGNHSKYIKKFSEETQSKHSRDKIRGMLSEMIKDRLIQDVLSRLKQSGKFEKAVKSVANGKTDPYTASDDLIVSALKLFK